MCLCCQSYQQGGDIKVVGRWVKEVLRVLGGYPMQCNGTPLGWSFLGGVKATLLCRQFSCFLLEGFVPLGGFLADQKPAKFCPSIRGREGGGILRFSCQICLKQVLMFFLQGTEQFDCSGLKIWQSTFKYELWLLNPSISIMIICYTFSLNKEQKSKERN